MKTFIRCMIGAMIVVVSLSQANVRAHANGQAQASGQVLEISATGQPDDFPLNMRSAQVMGFAGLTFGMSMEQVEQVISATWPNAQVERQHDPVQRITMLVFNLDDLAPVSGVPGLEDVASPARATVTCVFGYQSQQLTTINLDWYAEGDTTDAQRQTLLDAGSAYTAHMLGDVWPMMQSSRGHILGDGVLLLFAGRDIEGRGVEVRVHGVAIDVLQPEGGVVCRPAPAGGAQLHIGLSSMPDEPDVFRLPDNSF